MSRVHMYIKHDVTKFNDMSVLQLNIIDIALVKALKFYVNVDNAMMQRTFIVQLILKNFHCWMQKNSSSIHMFI